MAPASSAACPFCGIVTDVPHETQQCCIDALHVEIARVREILESVTLPEPLRTPRETNRER